MGYIIGTDEAGYGPNLGPLMIAATVWRVPGSPKEFDLYERLAGTVEAAPSRKNRAPDRPLAIADSKALHQPDGGLGLLERGVLSAAVASKSVASLVRTWRGVWQGLCPDGPGQFHPLSCHREYDEPLPVNAGGEAIDGGADVLRRGLEAAGVELVAMQATALFPALFNSFAQQDPSKGETLSRITIALAMQLAASLPPDGPVLVLCDKHGGRSHYSPYLQQHFPDDFIEVRMEGREESRYQWGPKERRIEARFCSKCERFLPVALASMTAKYLRELSMRAFNAFWVREVPGVAPTAGYPQDAKRFQAAIAARQRELNIADDLLWRTK